MTRKDPRRQAVIVVTLNMIMWQYRDLLASSQENSQEKIADDGNNAP